MNVGSTSADGLTFTVNDGDGYFVNMGTGTCVAGGSLPAGASCTVNVLAMAGCGPAGSANGSLQVAGLVAPLTARWTSGICY